ncbi:TetR family transcriptional regulator [Streptomyces phyllanthi]|uniref:TetR/AcrR family transcriptional regulator n=1 Tax=Streptomyces phyllanthi TaxID=1803180 RepID=A0A5N8W7B8_9ACTN|nr:TetR/AcrR family transcriptional regulator [Streptomyces phyllanthi]MPY43002.1 TetR/AcrR family transcriptional regulator [Streptomyces phyllanthi]
MVKQERAARTRESLIQAAAKAFDSAGFDGTSLGRVSAGAGISMGALTFHFRTKADLADAVQLRGVSLTRDAVKQVICSRTAELETVVAITLALVGLLEESTVVRAAARLSRERAATSVPWPSSWVPVVEDLLDRVPEQDLRPGTDPGVLLSLVSHLVTGAEVHIRNDIRSAEKKRTRTVAQVAEIWDIALLGVFPALRVP